MSHIWLIHMCDGLIHMYDMTHSYVSHDACTCMTWIGHMCPMTHSYVSHGSYIFVPWLIHTCDIQICKMNVRTHAIFTPTSTHTSAHARAHTQKCAHTQMNTHPQAYWHFWFSKMKHSAQSSTTTHTHCACSVQHQKCACAFEFISAYVFCAFLWCFFVWTQTHFGLKAPRLRWPSLLIYQWNSRRSARASRPSNSAMCAA